MINKIMPANQPTTRRLAAFLGMLCLPAMVSAQQSTQSSSRFSQYEAFKPVFYLSDGNDVRTASGRPGSKYWQNAADYKIDVTFDDEKETISGSVLITYKNNSPENLPFLWLQLDQNIYD